VIVTSILLTGESLQRRSTLIDKVTFAICSRNRSHYLRLCLESIYSDKTDYLFSVLVVDNNSVDSTKSVCKDFLRIKNNFSYVIEHNVGLSHARNTAIKNTSTNWIFFIDDDAKISSGFINQLYKRILENKVYVIGGRYIPWYENVPPTWMPSNFGEMPVLLKSFGILEDKFLAGGVMGFNLKKIEGNRFSIELGMKGNKVKYGEEVKFQTDLRKLDLDIYFDPDLVIEHLVPKYKLKKVWHLSSAFAHGRDSWKLFDRNRIIIKDILFMIKEFLFSRIWFFPDFNDQKKIAFSLGRIIGGLDHLK